jgi:acyl carrier protein
MVNKNKEEILLWMKDFLVRRLEVPAHQVQTSVPYAEMGLSSSQLIFLIGDLEEWLGIEIDTDVLSQLNTLDLFADYLVSQP